jgi:hypothetical protein
MVANIIEAIVISKYEQNVWLAISSCYVYHVKEQQNKKIYLHFLSQCALVVDFMPQMFGKSRFSFVTNFYKKNVRRALQTNSNTIRFTDEL